MTQKKRSTCRSCLVLIAWLCTAVPTDAQSITWDNTYEQMKASTTKSVLVHGQDSMIFTSKVNVAGPNHTLDRAHFEVKKHGSHYVTLCYVDLSNCGGNEVSNCYCRVTNEKNVVRVVLNLTADTYFSGAFLQGTIYHFEIKIKSKELKLPYIIDLSHPGIHVYINDKIDQLDFCNKTINQTTALIVVEKANNELQYLFTLQDKKTSVYLRNATNFLFHSVEIKEETVFRIAYQVSEIPKIRSSFECTVRLLLRETESADENFAIFVIVVLGVLVISLATLFITRFLWKKKIHRKFQIRDQKYSYSEAEQRPLTGTSTDQKNKMEIEEFTEKDKVKVVTEMVKDRVSSVTPVLDSLVGVTLPSEILNIIKDMKNVEDNQKIGNLKQVIDSQLDLMVILSINKVSDKRPENWPGYVTPYPSHSSTKNDVNSNLRTGIGRIVSANLKKNDGKTKYQGSTKDFLDSCEIDVYTSRHVVFDDEEAKQTDVILMIEGSEIPGAVVKGKCVRMANILQNWTLLTCVSNDKKIYESLHERVQRFTKEWLNTIENNHLFNITNEFGYIVSVKKKSIQSNENANLTELLGIYKKDSFQMRNSYTLNTQFNNENVAIFVERTSESLNYGLPKEMKLTFSTNFGNDTWIFGSIPLVIKNLSIQEILKKNKRRKYEVK